MLKYDTLWLLFGPSVAVVSPSSPAAFGYWAAAVLLVVVGPSLLCFVGRHAAAALIALSPQLSNDIKKGLLDVDTVLSRSLNKVTSQILGEGLSLLRGHFALGDTVALVSHEHDWCVSKDGSGCTDR